MLPGLKPARLKPSPLNKEIAMKGFRMFENALSRSSICEVSASAALRRSHLLLEYEAAVSAAFARLVR